MCSEVSLRRSGARYVFKIASNLTSDSARAIRSSTLPTKLNSLVSDVSVNAGVDIFFDACKKMVEIYMCYSRSQRGLATV